MKKNKMKLAVFLGLFTIGMNLNAQQTQINGNNSEKQTNGESQQIQEGNNLSVPVTQTTSPSELPSKKSQSGIKTTIGGVTDLPGFPVFIDTDNPEQDDANYAAAKAEWFAKNKRLVKKYYKSNNQKSK